MTLKLRYNPMSPYIRKVVVMISETGLEDRVQRVLTHPWTENTDIGTVNPLGKGANRSNSKMGRASMTASSSATISTACMTDRRSFRRRGWSAGSFSGDTRSVSA